MFVDRDEARVHFRCFLEIICNQFSFFCAFSSVIAVKMASFRAMLDSMCAYVSCRQRIVANYLESVYSVLEALILCSPSVLMPQGHHKLPCYSALQYSSISLEMAHSFYSSSIRSRR